MEELEKKEKILQEYLKSLGSVAVAFSSGVDSTFLLKEAKETLGNNVIAIIGKSNFFPKREFDEAVEFCNKEKIKYFVFETSESEIEGFSSNPRNRCYLCKKTLFTNFLKLAKENGASELVEGSNMDDLGDYRPGLKAISELDVKSPLMYAKFYKSEIRELSKKLGLSTWNKPSYACLASRFVYGENITKEKLEMVDKAEQLLIDMGFKQLRVRIHGNIARIEVLPEEIEKITMKENREKIASEFKKYGFSYVSVDLEGYKMGSMNKKV